MGYDMYWRRKDEGEDAATAAARAKFSAAVEERNKLPEVEAGVFNRAKAEEFGWEAHEAYSGRSSRFIAAQDKVNAAVDELDAAKVSYFRANIWGMGSLREAMEQAGMLFWPESRRPTWPEAEQFGLLNEEWWAYDEEPSDLDPEKQAAAKRFAEARDNVQSWHGSDDEGIPGHKFCTNDGWIVTPDECRQATAAWRSFSERAGGEDKAVEKLGVTDFADYWKRWVLWIERAADHDGFEVF